MALPPPAPRKYRWPWLVLGAVVLAALLAVFWMSREVARIKRIKASSTGPRSESVKPFTQPRMLVPKFAVWIN